MFDQLIINGIGSHDEFDASVATRQINSPKKKSIKEKVPFSNEIYDFSAINGEVYWDERALVYVFEITANSPEELEEKKQPFVSWIMNANNADIHDPFIADYHFKGTFDDIEFDDSEFEKSTITVTFAAYPYMISNAKRVYKFDITENEEIRRVINNSSHRITPTFICDVPFILKIGGSSYGISAGETTSDALKFEPGSTEIKLQAQAAENLGLLNIEFFEEVF